MTATYNTGKRELIFVEVPKWGSDFKIIHDDESSPYLSFQISNTKKDFIDEFTPGNYKIIGLFKDLAENDLIKLIRFDYTQSGIEIMHDIIKSQGLDPEKTLIIEKI